MVYMLRFLFLGVTRGIIAILKALAAALKAPA